MPVQGVQCLQCGRCVEVCPTTALEMCGRAYTMDELMLEIEKERDIMQDSGGGVTLCGGEPLKDSPKTVSSSTQGRGEEDVVGLLKELGRRGFHRAVDTTLYVHDTDFLMQVADECELFLVDLKLMDSARHKQLTGVGNEQILENLRRICDYGTDIWIRVPLIEGVNTDEDNIKKTAKFVASLYVASGCSRGKGVQQVNLLPYHDVGKDKHRRLWSTYNPQHLPMMAPSDETLQRCVQLFEDYGIKTIVGG